MKTALIILVFSFIVTASGQDVVYICEKNVVNYTNNSSDTLVLIAPGTSTNQRKGRDDCKLSVQTDPGLRLVVRVFTTFTINNCNRDLVSLSDGMKRIEICGQKQGEEVLFETSQSQLTIHYRSTSDNDLVSMVISQFGCKLDKLMEGPGIRFLPPSNMNSTANYTGEIQCSYPGYLMESNYTVLEATCYKENDGSYHWDKPLLKCEAASCPSALPHPENGRVNIGLTEYNSVISYRCNPGYILRGSLQRTCTVQNGRGAFWGGATPTCQIVDCGTLTIPNANLTIPTYKTTYNSLVPFSCNTGYSTTGNSTAICTAQGIWSYTPCTEIFCSKPSVPTNTVIISDVPRRAELGSILQTACYDVMTNITCVNHEVWNATLPICQAPSTAASAAEAMNPNVIIGICIAATIIVVLVIIVVIVVLVRRRKTKEEIREFNFEGPRMTSDYSEVEHGQSNNGQITMTVQPSTAAAPKPAQRTSQRSNQARLKTQTEPEDMETNMYAQINKRKPGEQQTGEMVMIDNDLYGSNSPRQSHT